jgi:hypothetical protein
MRTPREWHIKAIAENGFAKGTLVYVAKDKHGNLVAKKKSKGSKCSI